MSIERFWMVYGIGCQPAAHRHGSYQAAREEASRLAAKHAGTDFVVLAAIEAFAVKPNVVVVPIVEPPDFNPLAHEQTK